MKKLISLLIAGMMALSFASIASAATGTIKSSVNFRSAPRVADNKIGLIRTGTQVEVLEKVNAYWVKISYNGRIGYIAPSYLSYTAPEPAPSTPNEPSSSRADAVISLAQSLKDRVTYNYGTRNVAKFIFDCSSFTEYVFTRATGIDLAWGSRAQAKQGSAVSKSSLQRGDLVFFRVGSGTSIGHVGIYVGGGQFIHNTPSVDGVMTSSLTTGYWSTRYVTARRVL